MVSLDYIVGFLQTDGSFSLEFKKDATMFLKYRLLPVVSFYQKKESLFILEEIKKTLSLSNVKAKISNLNDSAGRAPRLRVEGLIEVEKMLTVLENCDAKLAGLKRLDFRIMKEIFSIIKANDHNLEKGRKEILDLKFYLHQPPEYPAQLLNDFRSCGLKDASLKPIPGSFRYSREKWESLHSFKKDSSKDAAKDRMKKIYNDFFQSCQLTISTIRNQVPSSLNPEYVSGMLDGNGSFGGDRGGKNESVFSITFANGNEQVLLEIAHYFQDKRPGFYLASGSQLYTATRKEVLNQLIDHLKKAPLKLQKGKKFL